LTKDVFGFVDVCFVDVCFAVLGVDVFTKGADDFDVCGFARFGDGILAKPGSGVDGFVNGDVGPDVFWAAETNDDDCAWDGPVEPRFDSVLVRYERTDSARVLISASIFRFAIGTTNLPIMLAVLVCDSIFWRPLASNSGTEAAKASGSRITDSKRSFKGSPRLNIRGSAAVPESEQSSLADCFLVPFEATKHSLLSFNGETVEPGSYLRSLARNQTKRAEPSTVPALNAVSAEGCLLVG
jgi:hypothetical protein